MTPETAVLIGRMGKMYFCLFAWTFATLLPERRGFLELLVLAVVYAIETADAAQGSLFYSAVTLSHVAAPCNPIA